jgi:hypothetical protein
MMKLVSYFILLATTLTTLVYAAPLPSPDDTTSESTSFYNRRDDFEFKISPPSATLEEKMDCSGIQTQPNVNPVPAKPIPQMEAGESTEITKCSQGNNVNVLSLLVPMLANIGDSSCGNSNA